MKYIRGSEWRKWDLHIHTPSSICQNYGGEEKWEDFISSLEKLPKEVKVIGITDYYFIDGYEKVMEYKTEGRLKNIEKVFPILEFRIDTFGSGNENRLQKINLHILFDVKELNLKTEIKKIKEEFIEQISVSSLDKHKTKKLSIENLTIEGNNDLKTGFESLVPPTKDVFNLINNEIWKDKVITFLGYKEWSNLEKNQQLKPLKADLYDRVSLFLTSNNSTIGKSQTWLNEFGDKILVHSGDIHNFNCLEKDYICDTWVKADPSFKGLKQAINEKSDRIYIGEEPPVLSRVRENSTKYIKSLEVTSIDGYSETSGEWFKEQNIPFNNELTAIIGNKGNGKSAIADILGLCGNCDVEDNDYVFLHKDKFKKNSLAKNFQAKINWQNSDGEKFINLNQKVDEGTSPEIKYITQGYFESLCNELNKADNFKKEIEKVVFQHLPENEKLGTSTFKEFIELKDKTIKSEINVLINELKPINSKIIKLEDRTTIEYISKIESELKKKETELEAHLKIKPVEVKKINENLSKEQQEENDNLSFSNERLLDIKNRIDKTTEDVKSIKIKLNVLETLETEIKSKKSEYDKFISDKKSVFEEYELNIEELFYIKINTSQIEKLKEKLNRKLNDKENLIDITNKRSFLNIKSNLETKIEKLTKKISKPEQDYQNYLKEIEKWNNKEKTIKGSKENYGTLEYYKNELLYIKESIESDIKSLRENRLDISIQIFNETKKMQRIYNEIKLSIDKILKENEDSLEDYPIKIESSLQLSNNFTRNFLNYVSQNISGSFYGKEDGEKILKTEILENKDFSEDKEMRQILEKIIEFLEFDRRKGKKEKTYINKLVKDREALYLYLFSLDYLLPYYELKQGGKSIEQLSPGEKGALLLVFYLLLDKSDIPLIIDQPEDNLDNHSVVKILVPFIKKAKEKRQIIMVTHNPNLAVVADAEQIIFVNIARKNNKFNFISGSVENKDINEKIVEVLEGTMPAFNNRKNKYHK